MKTPSSLLSKLIAAVASLALLWLAFSIYARGEPLWAVALLAFGGISLYIYLSATTLAWRYLFPGVAAMLIFVAFPLVYTIQIGFTNYSSNNLLTE
ncbi:MAG: maltose ABC transporter permease MalF, partial [Candidatus Saccharibacteria bacterium]|nr:maltose ABC transporter permease MalF [Rhodoferax sp.]